MKQPDPYCFEAIKMTSQPSQTLYGDTSHRRVFSVNFDWACELKSILWFQASIDQAAS